MSALTNAIREATLAASRLHKHLGLESGSSGDGRIDVFGAAARLRIPLLLKPLESLLGAYIRDPAPGVLITSRRPLSIQRFTAAHELGHYWMGHKPSLDDDNILRRVPFPDYANDDIQEVEANAFAAAFLLPQWVMNWHCKRQGWTNRSLKNSAIIYQLSLRAGLSYEATCWTLHRYKVLTRQEAQHLVQIEPKSIKKSLLGKITPENYYSDVWTISERDDGQHIEGGASDFLIVRLREHGAAGYLWRVAQHSECLTVLDDVRESVGDPSLIGGPATRRLLAQSVQDHSGSLNLVEERPWLPTDVASSFAIRYNLLGSEKEGLPRAERRIRLEAA